MAITEVIRSSIDSRAKIGLGGDFNLRQNKINIFGSANYNQRKSISTGYTDRYNILDQPNTYMHQDDKVKWLGNFKFFRAGLDYFIANRNTLSASTNIGNGTFRPESISELLGRFSLYGKENFVSRKIHKFRR